MVCESYDHWFSQQCRCLYADWRGNGDYHRYIDAGFNQVRIGDSDSDSDRAVHNHFGFSGLFSGVHPNHADIYLYGNRAGNRIIQFGGYLGRIRWRNHDFWGVHTRWYRHRDHNGNLDTGHLKIRHRDNTGWKSDFKRMDMDGR